jgi:DNA-binding LytR/AlgR family response regulator
MSAIRILAIEDEPIHSAGLKLAIQELGYVLIEVTDDIHEFQRLAKAAMPDILLIDIDLGAEIDGIELAEKIRTTSDAPVIFVTAFKDKQTILRAKDTGPSAYITKPYDASSLQAAIEIAAAIKTPGSRGVVPIPRNLFVKQDGRLRKLVAEEILFVEVIEKSCFLHTKNENVEVRMRLKELLDQLPAGHFIQIHRSYLVALNHIAEVSTGFEQITVGDQQLPVGKNYKDELTKFLKKLG